MSKTEFTMVRIAEATKKKLRKLADSETRSMSNYLTVLIDRLYETVISEQGGE